MAQNSFENPVHSVEKALTILETLGQKPQGFGITELGQLLGIHKSTVYRLISTLQAVGFAEKDPETDRYALGTKILNLGLAALNNLDFRKIAIPYMNDLAKMSRENVQLSVLNEDEILMVERVLSPEAVTVNLGLRIKSHCCSLGKVLLASLSNDTVRGIYKNKELTKNTENTLTEIDKLISHLEKIRAQGFAINAEEMSEGVRALAAPVFDQTGRVIASLGIAGPSYRLSMERIYQLVIPLKEVCASISSQLGYRI